MLHVFVIAAIAVVAVALVGNATLVAVVLHTRARVRRDDSVLFQDCVSRGMQRTRRFFALIPAAPRCRICYLPFGGIGRVLFPTSPSRQNPNFCRVCFERLPTGGQQMEIGVLFADLRGFTTLAERMPPNELARLSNRFYNDATNVLTKHDAIIDSFMGDGILALFLPPLPTLGSQTCDTMLTAARELVEAVSAESPGDLPPLNLGVAIHYGTAFVGNLGTGVVKELVAVGDVVTTAARLQQRAAAGEILVSDDAWERLTDRDLAAVHRSLALRGKTIRVGVHRIAVPSSRTPETVGARPRAQLSRTASRPPKQEM